MKKTVIKITNIVKGFKVGNNINTVLKDISLEIYKGELITIFGPSGCGKSTLLNIIMGIERPDSGEIEILGFNLWDRNADDRADMRKRNIGVVYQQQNWVRSLTVLENVALSAQLLGYSKEESIEKAKEKLYKVGMLDSKDQFTSELSAGEQQKVGLARALISNPQVIIADEPTGNLDSKSGYDVMKILKELVKEGTTVVLVTHNPEYLEYSDRVLVIKDGNLLNILKHTEDIRIKCEELIQNTKCEDKGVLNRRVVSSKETGELDYPEKSNTEKLKIYTSLFFRFFVESLILLISSLISKISIEKADVFKNSMSEAITKILSKNRISREISTVELTEISLKNIFFKKFRTIITILGVSVGTGFVLLLLSLGYGFEKIVVDEITKAKDLNQLDIYPKIGSMLVLDDELVHKVSEISGVEKVYKIKNLPGRVNYAGSSSDVVVYGIEEGYLESSQVENISGEYLTSNSSNTDVLLNTEYIKLFGLNKDNIIDQNLEIEIVQSIPSETKLEPILVTVKGVVEDEYPPVIYMKIEGTKQFTSDIYSQATVSVNNKSNLNNTRKQIESLGLETLSVMDTIDQVETLFTYIRYGLLVFGILAFVISFLGMINTLVVSLLERTREVGLMKIIGMKSKEIMTIFITESMFIGFLGGIFGTILGILGGYVVSLIVYVFSISRGVNFVMLSYIPIHIILLVVICTTLLGFITGLYPANRAVKIPPLDSIRYE